MNSEYILLTLLGGIGLSFLFADPPNRFHPLSWFGNLVSYFIPKLKHKHNNPKYEKSNGIIFALILTLGISLGSYYFSIMLYKILGIFSLMIYSLLVLKFTMAILTLEKHVYNIIHNLEKNNINNARKNLSLIVSRKTDALDREHVISGTIESIGESIVDGIGSPIFYYSLFGPAGAIAYRIINTLDSMIGYTDDYHYNMGWMAAKLDSIVNYIPARISALLLVISSKIIGADWKNSLFVLRRDHKNTLSVNAGYPISAMAGALRVKLEKVGQYELGVNIEPLSIEKCRVAMTIVKIAIILFYIVISLPLILLLSFLGWWNILYDF